MWGHWIICSVDWMTCWFFRNLVLFPVQKRLDKLPPYLIIHIKRFAFNKETNEIRKLPNPIAYESNIEFREGKRTSPVGHDFWNVQLMLSIKTSTKRCTCLTIRVVYVLESFRQLTSALKEWLSRELSSDQSVSRQYELFGGWAQINPEASCKC